MQVKAKQIQASLLRRTACEFSRTAMMVLLLVAGPAVVCAQTAAGAKPAADEPPPKFDPAFMADAANIKVGQEVWGKQCRHCHGNSAYPGKAPKLSPGSLEPEFIYDRVTFGFRGMPSWSAVFTLEERKAVVAYIKSNSFSP